MAFFFSSYIGRIFMRNNINFFVWKNLGQCDISFPGLLNILEMHQFGHLSACLNVYGKVDSRRHNFLQWYFVNFFKLLCSKALSNVNKYLSKRIYQDISVENLPPSFLLTKITVLLFLPPSPLSWTAAMQSE